MLIDISVDPGLSYFSRPRRDFSLLLVKPEIIVIQMFIYSYCCKRVKNRLGGLHHTVVVQIFSVLLSL